jgi:hypothetical protein
MIVEIGTVAAQFLFLEYLFGICGIGSLQCETDLRKNRGGIFKQYMGLRSE